MLTFRSPTRAVGACNDHIKVLIKFGMFTGPCRCPAITCDPNTATRPARAPPVDAGGGSESEMGICEGQQLLSALGALMSDHWLCIHATQMLKMAFVSAEQATHLQGGLGGSARPERRSLQGL